ncbi:N-acyl homoserine lactonase family protein [Allopusillimonas ginsengisoli]|uniref:N-acyl homoserine lactonase family protein n=1 Tax=Allopusillimonas ginsengisoli TaxID=453575 RepID=UPI00101EB549|nr:N-acyl homoserine lactonase family protein [Allopusillimonas ginsengisoli]TEA80262.1 N-acyl homoserine lactonase family protein [Allopusillimonas ginsengisoli]
MTLPDYEVYAIRYAMRDARRANHFIGGDPHDAPMPMDYYVWLVRGKDKDIVVDTGFGAEVARKRGRTLLRHPSEGLKLLGVDVTTVEDVIITHLHYDHVGTFDSFGLARFHLQDDEMSYATGRHMCHRQFNHGYEVEEVIGMVRLIYKDRVKFHKGCAELAPGLSIHRIGGHTHGLQCVRVHTKRGWVVLASDSSHYYEHFEKKRAFTTVFHVGELIDGYSKLQMLADSPKHIIPGHDPLVMQRYPAASAQLDGIAVRLDEDPNY